MFGNIPEEHEDPGLKALDCGRLGPGFEPGPNHFLKNSALKGRVSSLEDEKLGILTRKRPVFDPDLASVEASKLE